MNRFFAALFTISLSVSAAYACTGIYVGRKVSLSGNTLVGRTIDSGSPKVSKMISVFPRVENRPGRVYVGGAERGGWPLPDTTWKFVATPVANVNRSIRYDSACLNEKGLAISGTVTGSTNEEALRHDPFVKAGFGESSVVGLLAQCCTNARQVVELLGRVIAAKGHDMPEIYVALDENEAWYVEVYTGHQWAAVKMPDDKVLVIGNQFMIGEFDPSAPDVMSSPGIISLPVEKGFAKRGPGGKVNLAATYGKKRSAYSNNRTWFGHTVFAPTDNIGDFVEDREYPMFYKPSRRISKRDVFELMRSRYEGTKYCPEETGNEDIRVIGTTKQCSCHVLEILPSLPEDKRAVMWMTMANSEHSPFLPVSAAVTEVHGSFNTLTSGLDNDFNPALAAHNFRRLAILAETDRKMLGAGVRKYWRALEDKWMSEFDVVVTDGSAAEITSYCMAAQKRALEDAKTMFDELNWYLVHHSLIKGDLPGRNIPEKTPYVFSRPVWKDAPGPRIAIIAGAISTNGTVTVQESLVRAVEKAGYSALVMPCTEDEKRIEALMNTADALLIGGMVTGDSWRRRLWSETRLVDAAIKRGIPVLGFCHGHQLLNIYFGGTIGRIDTNNVPRIVHMGRKRPLSRNCFHTARVEKGSWLHSVVGKDEFTVNSSHRYELKKIGKGLRVSARSPDGTVEAIEHVEYPVTGFQFHPETIGDKGEIYDRLIREALNRRPAR